MIVMKDIVREGHPALRIKKAEEITFPLSTEESKTYAMNYSHT